MIMTAGGALASQQPDLLWEGTPGELLDPSSGSTVLFALYLKLLLRNIDERVRQAAAGVP